MKTAILASSLLGAALLLSACYEDADVTMHEPGQYKGKSDPLLQQGNAEDRAETLAERFNTVQTDR